MVTIEEVEEMKKGVAVAFKEAESAMELYEKAAMKLYKARQEYWYSALSILSEDNTLYVEYGGRMRAVGVTGVSDKSVSLSNCLSTVYLQVYNSETNSHYDVDVRKIKVFQGRKFVQVISIL